MADQCCTQDFAVNDSVTDTQDSNRQATVIRLHPAGVRNAIVVQYTDNNEKEAFFNNYCCARFTKN
jgi:hypothetical protein